MTLVYIHKEDCDKLPGMDETIRLLREIGFYDLDDTEYLKNVEKMRERLGEVHRQPEA